MYCISYIYYYYIYISIYIHKYISAYSLIINAKFRDLFEKQKTSVNLTF